MAKTYLLGKNFTYLLNFIIKYWKISQSKQILYIK